jgi:hypothetical protein
MRCECEANDVGRSKLEVERSKFGFLGGNVDFGGNVQRSTSNV